MNHRQNGCLKSGFRQRSLLHDCCRHRGCHRRMSCCCCCHPSVRRSCCPKSEKAARWMERRCGWAGCWRVRRTRASCSRWSGAQRWCGSSCARLRRLGYRMYGCCRSRPKTAGWLVRQTKSCCCCGCNTMLAGSCLCDDTRLAHFFCKKYLSQNVIDLVGSCVV